MKNLSNVVFFNYKIGQKVLFKVTGIKYKVIGRIETITEDWPEEDREKRGPITKFYVLGKPDPKNGQHLEIMQAFEDQIQPAGEEEK